MKHALLVAASVISISVSAQMGFTPNQGQISNQSGQPADNVLFKACGTGPGIFITETGMSYVFTRDREAHVMNEENRSKQTDWSAIHMELVGADIRQENIVMEDELPGVTNYYFAHCPNGVTGVKSYHKITIKNIYPGIDWMITADDVNGMAHDFVVHPGGNHQMIRMKYTGLTSPITRNTNNQLVLNSAYGTMYEGGLKVFRSDNGAPLQAWFNIEGNEVNYYIMKRFVGGMVIDPPLQWNSLQASTGMDYGYGVAACKDGSGDVLGCGHTDGTDFPDTNATQGSNAGQEDAVVYRLDANGNRLWATYFGGTDIDNAKGIATDAAGNAYVTGNTYSSDLPVMSSLQANFGGGTVDAFIAKYNSTGVMQWASWRGGIGNDFGTAITSTASGTCYVTGYTSSSNFPTLLPYQGTKAAVYDAFVFSVNTLQVMQWSTFYGGDDEDRGYAIALDATETNVIFGGNTMSGGFPITSGVFQNSSQSAYFAMEGFIVKMPVTGTAVVFGTYVGGGDEDNLRGVTCDPSGNIYATGYTTSMDFPKVVEAGAFNDTSFNSIGVQDPFIVKVNPTGSTLLWSTFFGGTMTDYGFAITYDLNYGIYVCGNTVSTDFVTMQPNDLQYYQSAHGDGGNFNDMWIAWFDINDSLRWSTYYGNSMGNEAYGVSCGQSNQIYVTGVDSNEISVLKFNPGSPTEIYVCLCEPVGTAIWPVPADDILNFSYQSASDGIINVEILDMRGRLVQTHQLNAANGANMFVMDISALERGGYLFRYTGSDETEVIRFVKR